MPHDDLIQTPPEDLAGALKAYLERLDWPGAETIAALLERLAPSLEALLERLTSPPHLATLQGAMTQVANSAISLGFSLDPGAALLFEFASWLEEEHGRPAVLERLLAHSPLQTTSLLSLLARSLLDPPDASPETKDSEVLAVRRSMLQMLCALTELDEQRPWPEQGDIERLAAYFERAVLPPRFEALLGLALGHQGAFDALMAEHQHARREQAERGPLAARLKHALFERAFPRDRLEPGGAQAAPETPPQHQPPGAHPTARALARPQRARSDALNFLTASYLLFVQTTLTRAVLEAFPEAIAEAKRADQERAREGQGDEQEVLEMAPSDDASSKR